MSVKEGAAVNVDTQSGGDIESDVLEGQAGQALTSFEETPGYTGNSKEGSRYEFYQVPSYDEVDEQTRAQMDAIIARIDMSDISSIYALGQDALEELARVAKEVEDMGLEENNEILSKIDNVSDNLQNVDISSIPQKALQMGSQSVGWMARNPGTTLTTAGAFLFLGPLAAASVPFGKRQWDKHKLNFRMKMGQAQTDEMLRDQISNIDTIINDLEECAAVLPGAMEKLNMMGIARLRAIQDISLVIGSGLEKLRRVDEEDIPCLAESLENENDYARRQELQMEYENINMTRDALDSRLTDLANSRLISEATVYNLTELKKTFAAAHGKIQSHMSTSVPQWRAQVAEGGIQLMSAAIMKTLKESDEYGNEMMETSNKLLRENTAKMRKSLAQGTYNTDRSLKLAQEVSTTIQQDMKLIGQHRQQAEEARLKLSHQSEKLRDQINEHTRRQQETLTTLPHQTSGNEALTHDPSQDNEQGNPPAPSSP